jgi:hypothetical protein
MPPPIGVSSTPVAFASYPPSTHVSGRWSGPSFKGVQSFIKRVFGYPTQAKTRPAFVLVRGENEAHAKKAQTLRARIDGRTAHMRKALRHAPNTDAALRAVREDVVKLQRDEEKLQRLTHQRSAVPGVLKEQSIKRYLHVVDDKKDAKRCKDLFKLQTGPLSQLRNYVPALRDMRDTLKRETAIEASLAHVQTLYRAYDNEDGQPKRPAEIMHALTSLSGGMNMLRAHDQEPADFLYPAVKVMHERCRNASGGAQDRALLNLLRDLSTTDQRGPGGLRAQLGKDRNTGMADFYLLGKRPVSGQEGLVREQRDMLINDMETLLDGLAKAAWQVEREDLLARVPDWARDIQPALFNEARTLYQSAQDWRQESLTPRCEDPLFDSPPAATVDMLLEAAMDGALRTPGAPATDASNDARQNWRPLLANLTSQLSRLAGQIDQTFTERQIGTFPVPGSPNGDTGIAALRRELMEKVLQETGVWRETARLKAAPVSVPDPRATSARPGSPAAPYGSAPVHPRVRQPAASPVDREARGAMKRAKSDTHRYVGALLRKCQKGDVGAVQTFLSSKAQDLVYARRSFIHGNTTNESWKDQIEAVVAANFKGDASLELEKSPLRSQKSALRAHVHGGAKELSARIADPGVRQETDEILGEIWAAIRDASSRQKIAGPLQKWCDALGKRDGEIAGKELFDRINDVRGAVGKVDKHSVLAQGSAETGSLLQATMETGPLLRAAMRDLSDSALGNLIASETNPDTREAVNRQLSHYSNGPHATPDKTRKEIAHIRRHLVIAAHAEAGTRLDAYKHLLAQKLAAPLHEAAGKLYSVLDDPRARQANGMTTTEVVQGLMRDAVARVRTEHGERGAIAATLIHTWRGTRFIRTFDRYHTEAVLTTSLRELIKPLYTGLETKMAALAFPNPTLRVSSQHESVQQILEETGLWTTLDKARAMEQARRATVQPSAGVPMTEVSQDRAQAARHGSASSSYAPASTPSSVPATINMESEDGYAYPSSEEATLGREEATLGREGAMLGREEAMLGREGAGNTRADAAVYDEIPYEPDGIEAQARVTPDEGEHHNRISHASSPIGLGHTADFLKDRASRFKPRPVSVASSSSSGYSSADVYEMPRSNTLKDDTLENAAALALMKSEHRRLIAVLQEALMKTAAAT